MRGNGRAKYAVLALALAVGAGAEAGTLGPDELYELRAPSVYMVIAARSREALRDKKELNQGSAVAISPNLAVTNCHVIEDRPVVYFYVDGKADEAIVEKIDKHADICILRAARMTLVPVTAARAHSDLRVGSRVYAIGAPRGLERTLTEGIISALRDRAGVKLIQSTAPISPGSSGGGLFDAEGNLVGVTTARREDAYLNFAVAVGAFLPHRDAAIAMAPAPLPSSGPSLGKSPAGAPPSAPLSAVASPQPPKGQPPKGQAPMGKTPARPDATADELNQAELERTRAERARQAQVARKAAGGEGDAADAGRRALQQALAPGAPRQPALGPIKLDNAAVFRCGRIELRGLPILADSVKCKEEDGKAAYGSASNRITSIQGAWPSAFVHVAANRIVGRGYWKPVSDSTLKQAIETWAGGSRTIKSLSAVQTSPFRHFRFVTVVDDKELSCARGEYSADQNAEGPTLSVWVTYCEPGTRGVGDENLGIVYRAIAAR